MSEVNTIRILSKNKYDELSSPVRIRTGVTGSKGQHD
jgi:hypothetical protein